VETTCVKPVWPLARPRRKKETGYRSLGIGHFRAVLDRVNDATRRCFAAVLSGLTAAEHH
jgi:hypothetical protein